jgi:uncharacterized protein YxeA
MIKKIVFIIVVLLFIFSSAVYAENYSIGIKTSTLGIGLEAERNFTDSMSARLGVNYFSYDYSGTKDDIEYDFDLNLMSVTFLIDWHPFQDGFRLSGGMLYNGNNIDADAKSSATYKIGDSTFTSAQVGTLTGDIDFNKILPYLGIGWDKSFGEEKRYGLLFEVGAIYQGSPDVNLNASGPIATDANFLNEIAKEEDNLASELDSFKVYPVFAVSLRYKF